MRNYALALCKLNSKNNQTKTKIGKAHQND